MKNSINTTFRTSLAIVLFVTSTISVSATQTQIVGFDVNDFDIGNMLTWQTTIETNNKEFVIERSTDGLTFKTIGSVQGKGTTADKQKYSFLDISADKGLTKYRLKQVNLDGTFKVSNLIKIDKSGANNFTITSMTPLEEGGIVEIALDVKQPSTITYNVKKLGEYLVYTATQTLKKGKNVISVDVSELGVATYEISIEGDNEKESIVFKNRRKNNIHSFADFDDEKKD